MRTGDAAPSTTHPHLRLVEIELRDPRQVVVAIPVRNEVARIEQCLRALAQQSVAATRVVLLLNGCIDGTADLVRTLTPQLGLHIDTVERDLRGSDATAGMARSLAVRHAARGLAETDVILTTDADGAVASDWIAANLAAMRDGVEVVCGRAVIDWAEALLIPAHLHDDDARECRLAALIDELAHWLDPQPHDPLPRHSEHSGASLAFTVQAWRRAGGIPPVPCGEDRAFVAALQSVDALIRHDPDVVVTVSGRMHGRAAGGMADTIRRRIVEQDPFIDSAIETAPDRLRRISLRIQARAIWSGRHVDQLDLAEALGVGIDVVQRALAAPYFGQAWAALERDCKTLAPRPVRFVDLPREIAVAEELRAFVHEAALAQEQCAQAASA